MSKKKEVYTLANAHLDTIWSWDFETTVRKYIYNTLADNFRLFEKYPDYRFNFEGSYRYELMEEYYPDLFEKMKKAVADGRWNPTGSAYENGDVNVPSPEALFRNILYGNGYFQKTFGKKSNDIFLPDCFGFGYALPTIAHHAGLKGFSTQKLSWGSAYGIPFDLGKWYGVDGNYIYASLNTNSYTHTLTKVRKWQFIMNKLEEAEKYGLHMTAVYHGTGDRGGAPLELGVKVLVKEMRENEQSDTKVYSSSPTELFDALDSLDDSTKEKLPSWDNELLMSTHAVGSYVSRSISKRWNRRGEELADLAERAAVCAYILGRDYPHKTFEECWKRIIRHHFHDDITGTSVQRAYKRVWNDYALAINGLIGEYESSVGYISSFFDSSWVQGTAILVNNPAEYDRSDIVEISGSFDGESYFLTDKEGNKYPCQKTAEGLIFRADMKSLGYKVFDLQAGKTTAKSNLRVSEKSLENKYIKASINDDGYVSSIIDKETGNELLKEPIRLAIYDYFGSKSWPAWEIPFDEATGQAFYPSLINSTVTENGPLRVSVKLEYEFRHSRFSTVISLRENGQALEFYNEIIWQELGAIAKQVFSLNASNENARFDLGLGSILRGNRNEKLYEVPAQKWADLSDGKVSVSVISDSKYSWDKYDDSTLRLTVLHTPKKNYRIDSMQSMMDLGLNRYAFAVVAHEADNFVKTERTAKDFHQKMPAFRISKHGGKLGSEYSFASLEGDGVVLRAMKKAEDSDSIVVRFNEINATENTSCEFKFKGSKAQEILADESVIADAEMQAGSLRFSMVRFEVKSFSIKPERISENINPMRDLYFDGNISVCSDNSARKKDLIPKINLSVPSELIPDKAEATSVRFMIDKYGKALLARGDNLKLADDTANAYLLCASLDGDRDVVINGETHRVNAINENFAGWDLYDYKETAFIKDGRLGLEFTHCHSAGGDEIAKQLFFWLVKVKVTDGVLTLPDDEDILILSITCDSNKCESELVTELFEKVEKREFNFEMDEEQKKQYKKFKRYSMMNDKGRYLLMYNK